jgi:hypothetical protein
MAQNWECVHQAAFVWHSQPLNPEISFLVLYLTRGANGQAKAEDLAVKTTLRKLCAEEHIALGIFAADGDPQYNQTHSIQ